MTEHSEQLPTSNAATAHCQAEQDTQYAILRSKHFRNVAALVVASALMPAIAPADAGVKNEHYHLPPTIPALKARPLPLSPSVCGEIRPNGQPTDSLRINGARLQDSRGRTLLLEGISLVAGPEEQQYQKAEPAAEAQVEAGVAAWHTNTVRVQVSQANLFQHPTPGLGYNRRFAGTLNHLLCKIIKLHEIPVVNVNTWFTGDQPNPTRQTARFWDVMSRFYKHLPVIFDLFNEPRLKHPPGSTALMNDQKIWRLWQFGGKVGNTQYVGMQALVNEIRGDGAQNVIWAESPYETTHVSGLIRHRLKGMNIGYAFHKLSLEQRSVWKKQIAAPAKAGLALFNGEWTLFGATNRPWECYDNAYSAVPAYLRFMQRLKIGVDAWSLQQGVLVNNPNGQTVHDGNYLDFTKDPKALETPTVLKPDFACDQQGVGQGAGALLMQYFKKYATHLPTGLFPKFVK